MYWQVDGQTEAAPHQFWCSKYLLLVYCVSSIYTICYYTYCIIEGLLDDVVSVDCWMLETVFEVSLKAGLDFIELTFFDKLISSRRALVSSPFCRFKNTFFRSLAYTLIRDVSYKPSLFTLTNLILTIMSRYTSLVFEKALGAKK